MRRALLNGELSHEKILLVNEMPPPVWCDALPSFCTLHSALCIRFVTRLLPSSAILCQMEAVTPPLISSFIIRFVMEETPAYHGVIRHIQSAEELNFNEWKEAFEFMRRFVPLDELQPPPPLNSPITNP